MDIVDLSKEIVFGSADSTVAHRISQLVRKGKLRRIAPRLYTSNLIDSAENIIRRNILSILVWRFPGTIISHRSANEMRLTEDGFFFLTGSSNRTVTELPGIKIVITKGPAADEGDMPYGKMHISGEYRCLLENLQASRRSGASSKCLAIEQIEKKLESVLLSGGEASLNAYRDQLKAVAQRLNMQKEFGKANKIISALLSSHPSDVLTSPSAKAAAAGTPYDESRLKLFEILYFALKNNFFPPLIQNEQNEGAFRLIAFFESYFSNYIEGTEFSVEEARSIVESGVPIPIRTEDSHDIIGTFQIASNRQEMSVVPSSASELIDILRHRHSILLFGRPQMQPGIFKKKNNRAGNTEFVDYQEVVGTLSAGFQYYAALDNAFAKAVYMMFLISEVHPFNDGNGRMARIMMNAELVHSGLFKIIVPTVYREDYLLALRKLSRQGQPDTFIQVMRRLHQFSANLTSPDFKELDNLFRVCNAYELPSSAKLVFPQP